MWVICPFLNNAWELIKAACEKNVTKKFGFAAFFGPDCLWDQDITLLGFRNLCPQWGQV